MTEPNNSSLETMTFNIYAHTAEEANARLRELALGYFGSDEGLGWTVQVTADGKALSFRKPQWKVHAQVSRFRRGDL